MNIEKVSNGYVVEVSAKINPHRMSSLMETKKTICPDLITLLNFINAHYGNAEAKLVVMKHLPTLKDE